MANALYDPGREGFLDGSIDWDSDDIRVILLGTGYAFSAAHRFVADLTPGTNEVARTAAGLTGKTVTGGVADAADVSFPLLAGTEVAAIVLFKEVGGADATRRLIAFIDTATGLPFTPSGGDLTIAWDNGANRIFKL